MKVLVTGAAGGLGRRTCRVLHERGFEIRATDVVYAKDLPVRQIVADLRNDSQCYSLVEGVEALVHLGNLSHPHADWPQVVYGDNCRMNINLFQAALELGVSKIVFASSIHVTRSERTPQDYQRLASAYSYLPVDGSHPRNPANTYGLSKAAGEMALESFARFQGLPSAIAIRFPRIIHPEHFDRRRMQGRTLAHVGPRAHLDELFAWLSSSDAVSLIEAVLRRDLPGFRVYAPAHPKPSLAATPREIIEKFLAEVPLRKPIEQIEALFDNSLITAETGWRPVDDLWQNP